MQKVIEKLKEIKIGEVGVIIYSDLKREKVCSVNERLSVPLASSAKVVIAFCIVKLVEEGHYNWSDKVEEISFDPNEDSIELYPHFQGRESLLLQDAVEVMIACHDNVIANSIIQFCGGWEKLIHITNSYFENVDITRNPSSLKNNGELSQVFELLYFIFEGYKSNPELWTPVINGLVRQQGEVEGIPSYFLNHMTGGLTNSLVNIGILGEFSRNPLLYVLGAKNLPNRYENTFADEKIINAIKLLYTEYFNKEYISER
ncbi:serine hydrolase [Ornithinibacillus sp. L9]|uniref:Serine hydrolase n=1 Tax=Ornithinibacillus caprae TaxID=2678566 RepID=A0A6N8FFC8_9BACI|nr:serine hydrolase [Ornithinibacillus caprae]MUK87901.1 serine hydrolase [Ornithinibacillus caprae]